MALPKMITPEYDMMIPSTGEEISYRPFLVGEEKLLLLAAEGGQEREIQNSILGLVNTCTFGKIGKLDDPLFDIEYAFLKIRGKSVSETIDLKLTCPDDEKTVVDFKLDTELVKVLINDEPTNIVKLSDTITLVMRYPTFKDANITIEESNVLRVLGLIKNCVHEIHFGDEIYNKIDITEQELDEFFDSMTQEQFAKVQEFFNTMPRLRHVIKVKNPNTKVKNEITLEGLQAFFE